MKRTIFITTVMLQLLTSLTMIGYGRCNDSQDTLKKSATQLKQTSGTGENQGTKVAPSGSNQSTIIRTPKKDTLGKKQSPFTTMEPKDTLKAQAQEYFRIGSAKEMQGDYQGAVDEFSKSLSLYKNGNTYLKRGLTYIALDNYPLALEDMNEAVNLLPSNAKVYFSRGVCLYEMGDFIKADEDLSRCVELDSTNKNAFNYKAAIKFQERDLQGALKNYDMVIKLDTNYKEAYTNRGMIRHYLKDYKGAVEDYDKALKLDPYNPTAYNNRGAAKITLQDYESAITDFDAALQLKDDYPDAYANRGDARLKSGDNKGACEDWQKAYSLGMESSMELIVKYCK